MKQSGILDITGLKDVCAVLQFIDEVSMIRFIDIFGVLKLQETLNSSVNSVLKLLQLFCRRNLSVGCNKTFWMLVLIGYVKSLN